MDYGNRWKYGINEIIIDFMTKEQTRLDKSICNRKRDRIFYSLNNKRHRLPAIIAPNWAHSFARLFSIIKEKGHPRVHPNTVRERLNRMVKEGILEKYPKVRNGRSYKRYYVIAPKRKVSL